MSKLLGRDQILNAEDVSFEDVDVPEWGGVVRIRALTARERDAFEALIVRVEGKEIIRDRSNASAKLLAMTAIDEEGNLIFSQADVTALGNKSAEAMQRAVKVAMRLSGLSEEAAAEATENFTDDPSADSPSA